MTLTVLLVEDSHGDVALMKEALKDTAIPVQLHVVTDGEQALCFLRHDPPYQQAPSPDLIFLDLHIPKVHGHDVLAALHHVGSMIPVIVFSSSGAAADIRRAYTLCANAYLQKPLELEAYLAKIRATVDYFGVHVSRAIS